MPKAPAAPTRPKPTCAIQEITPEQAREWLDLNHANRRLQDANVNRLRTVIERNEWMEDSTDGIGLDVDGGVVNGQHRLRAIADSGITVEALVVRNVRPEVIKVIDQGLPRSLSQILQMDGRYEYASDLAGAILFLWRIANDYEKSLPQAQRPFVPQLLEHFMLHPHIYDSMATAVDTTRPFKFVQRTWMCAYHYLMASIDPEAADDFFSKLESGSEIANGDPVYALREKLLANMSATKPEPGGTLAAWLIKAWETHRVGENMTKAQLKYISKGARAEEFPKLSGISFTEEGALVLGGQAEAA